MADATRRPRPRARAGMTLIEIMISVSLLVLLFAAVVPLFQNQSRLVARQAGRGDALQAARFAGATIERELRIAGPPNEVEEQPLLVQADGMALTVNADLNSRDTTSASAVYFDPDVEERETLGLTAARAVTLPRSGVLYPAMTYVNPAGVPSDAETISFWLSRDTSAPRDDQFTLWRRVNDGDSTAVAHDIIMREGRPFFTYYQPGPRDTLEQILPGRLPRYHSVAAHGAGGDTGVVALVDSVREVRVTAELLYRDPKLGDTTYTSRFAFRLLNAGLIRRNTCGTPPRAVTVSLTPLSGGVVRLSWSKSVDDGSGELDVRRYTLYRREAGVADWGEPFRGVRARSLASYVEDDTDAKASASVWEYSIMAQDCTPTNSARSPVASVTIP